MTKFKRKEFGKALNENLGIISRKGGNVVVKIQQIGEDGKPLNPEAVGNQEFVLDSTGKNSLKIRGAYHKSSPFCAYLPNEATGKTAERVMPLPMVAIASFEDVESIPQEIKNKEVKGKIPDYLYSKLNDDGEVVSEAREVEGKRWCKVDLNVPTYYQYYNGKGEPYTEENSNDGENEKGFYRIVTNKFAYASLVDIGFFNGHAVDEANNEIKGSKGTYMVPGAIGETNFIRLNPLRSGGKVGIASRINKVFRHPEFGVVTEEQVTKTGYLKKGKFLYAGGRPVRLAVYDGLGNVAIILDRDSYKLTDFIEKKKRNVMEEVIKESAVMGTKEVIDTVVEDDEDII